MNDGDDDEDGYDDGGATEYNDEYTMEGQRKRMTTMKTTTTIKEAKGGDEDTRGRWGGDMDKVFFFALK